MANAPLFKLKLLDALKSNDIQKVNTLYNNYLGIDTGGIAKLKSLVLHIAIQVSSYKLFEELIKSEDYRQLINYQDDDGNTPLHAACLSQRRDIVEILLNQPFINDTILNHDNQQPIDLIKNNPNLFNYVQLHRIKYVEKVSNDLRRAFTNRDFKVLNSIYSNPRNFELLDINGLDPDSGDTVLHEFIKKRDIEMVQWILAHGGDPFKRDKRGKLPIEILTKLKASGQAEQLRKILKKASKEQSVIDPVSNTQSTLINSNGVMEQAPTFKGYLKKWTNFASGYKLRWFILDSQGILSYYKNQDDINSNCRGSINLKNCRLHLDSSEKLKFEILGIKNANIKWHLKGNHSVETNRWVWAISNAIKFAKDREKAQRRLNNQGGTGILTSNVNSSTATLPEYSSVSRSSSSGNKKNYASSINSKTPFEYTKAPENHLSALHSAEKGHVRNPSNASSLGSIKRHNRSASELSQTSGTRTAGVLKNIKEDKLLSPVNDSAASAYSRGHSDFDLEDDIDDNGSESGNLEVLQFNDDLDSISADSVSIFDTDITNAKFIGPYGNDITILQKTLYVQLNSLNELISSFINNSVTPETTSEEDRQNIVLTATQTLDSTLADYKEILTLIHRNNFKLVKKLNNELHVNGLWESSIRELEQENIKNVKKIEQYEYERKRLRKILRDKLLHAGVSDVSSVDNDLDLSRIVSGAVHDAEQEKADSQPFTNDVDALDKTYNKPKNNAATGVVGAGAGLDAPKPIYPGGNEKENMADDPELIRGASSFTPRSKNIFLTDSVEDQKLMEFVEQKDTDSDSDDEFFDVDDFDEDYEQNDTSNFSNRASSEDVDAIGVTGAANTAGAGAANIPTQNEDRSYERAPVDGQNGAEMGNDESTLAESAVGTTNEHQLAAKQPTFEQENGITKASPVELNPVQSKKNELLLLEKTYNGYEDPIRVKLSKDEDDRPKISLWGILKSMVGKDMTKITLPVSFNECTSLLQRVAEGVEYTELLDKAASIEDSTLRLCYVAAFGASEYASTINRVAKPFNPLLGETFEYARPDKNFRFFVEQVSHHPPISAALAESPRWDYYGESAVKSKFNGRSFDIKPLGKWFLHLRPDHFVNDKAGNKLGEEEIYTWNRVTSSVVGIIVGNPVVDNYGEMNITNHTTGDHVVLNFKARGWRASSAYEVKGTVYNKNDEPCYLIKGHWDSKIYCKKIGKHDNIDNFDSGSSEKFLIWQVNPRPPRPFNLTLFSISLNALQPHLKNWLAPTDTRLRPDQRAMEDGRYDEAADEKNRVEEKQRAARKEREEKGIKYQPKFFSKNVHPVTNDPYWKYNGQYWKKRAEHDLANTGDIF